MADVRALLKAKRQEARVNHPLASYSSDNVLRCAACSTVIKHASAWQGHVGSKGHRLNVARMKQQEEEEERRREQQEQEEEDEAEEDDGMEVDEGEVGGKRRRPQDEQESAAKKQRVDAEKSQLPAGFFSDPTRSLAIDEDGEEDDEEQPGQPSEATSKPPTSAIDEEYLAFQRELLDAPSEQDVYRNATTVAEPEMASEVPEGFPPRQTDDAPVEEEPVLDEAEIQRRKEAEERELIMDRLLDEERAQEDADMKVTAMKAKLEAFKQRRRGKGKQ